MFGGEESIRIPDQGGEDKTFEFIEQNLDKLGRVRISDRGHVSIVPRGSFENALSKCTMDGFVRQRKNGEYEIVVNYTCTLNTAGWVILVVGVLLFLIGILVILVPMLQKGEVSRKVARALQDLE